jgi:hypothetical protein
MRLSTQAATVVSTTLQAIIAKAVEGANIIELCAEGDKLLEAGTAGLYNKVKGVPKGEFSESVIPCLGSDGAPAAAAGRELDAFSLKGG